jgi:hypothetical protein
MPYVCHLFDNPYVTCATENATDKSLVRGVSHRCTGFSSRVLVVGGRGVDVWEKAPNFYTSMVLGADVVRYTSHSFTFIYFSLYHFVLLF